jgi:hypothetical protein
LVCSSALAIVACGLDRVGLAEGPDSGTVDEASAEAASLLEASANGDAGIDLAAPDAVHVPDAFGVSDAVNVTESAIDASGSLDSTSHGDSSSMPDAPGNDAPQEGGTSPDVDAAPPLCNPTSPFGTPVLVAGLESSATEGGLRMTPDETTGFFWSTRSGGPGTVNLYLATRPDRAAAFQTVTLLSSVDVAGSQYDPSVTADALTLAFGSDRASSDGTFDLFLATRATTSNDFSGVTAIADLNTSSDDQQPSVLPDGSEIYFASNRSGDSDIYRARSKPGGGFDVPTAVTELNVVGFADEHPAMSADDLTIFFSSTRPGGLGNIDVWVATRTSATAPFGTPTDVGPVNTASKDIPDWISPDGCRLYLHSDSNGGSPHEYVARRSP